MKLTRSPVLGKTLALFALLAMHDVPAAAPAAEAPRAPIPAQVRTVPGYYRMMLGAFEVTALSDGTVTIPLGSLLTRTRPGEVAPLLRRAGLDPANVETSINAFLIHTGTRLVLVDAGAGKVFPNAGRIVHSLRAAGYRPEDVTDVLITHIHADHSAGLTVDGKAVFPNAVVHVRRREADFWLDSANEVRHPRHAQMFVRARKDLVPYAQAGRVSTFEADGDIVPGIRAIAAPGHTPGHTFFSVESQGRQLVLWGDLIHGMDAQFHRPDIAIQYDIDEDAAAKQRKAAMADAGAKGYLVGAAHISFPGIGRVVADGSAYVWLPVNYEEAGLARPADQQ